MDINKFIDKYGVTIQHQLSIAANQVYGVVLNYYKLNALLNLIRFGIFFLFLILTLMITWIIVKGTESDMDDGLNLFAGVGIVMLILFFTVAFGLLPNIVTYVDPQWGVMNDIVNKFNGN